MKKTLLSLSLTLLLFGCNQSYTLYIHYSSPNHEDEIKTIRAKDDSTAYAEAFASFILAQTTGEAMQKQIGENLHLVPEGFSLYDKSGQEIVVPISQDDLMQIKLFYSPDCAVSLGGTRNQEAIDSLMPYFHITKDEFDPNNPPTWYQIKDCPSNEYGLLLLPYFSERNGSISDFFLKIRYATRTYGYDYKRLNIKKFQFLIDKTPYEFVPMGESKSHIGNYRVYEEFVERINHYDDIELVHKIATADTIKVKIVCEDDYHIEFLDEQYKKILQKTIDLYSALGGRF